MARRLLDRPPSERYGPAGGEVGRPGPPHAGGLASESERRGWRPEVGAIIASVVTAVVLVIVGGLLGMTTGLLFVAGIGGAASGLLLAGSTGPPMRLRIMAIAMPLAAVATGAVGGWLVAVAEGGALGLVDYLWATTGLLTPAEAVVAVLAATWGLRAGPITA